MTKEQLAEQYAEEQNSAYTNDYYGFLAGFEKAIERVKEYLFNTEEHTEQYKNDPNYISPEYLKQIIKFLNKQ